MAHTDFTAALNELDEHLQSQKREGVAARWELVPFTLQVVALRIENEKLIEMRKQTEQLSHIADYMATLKSH
jgi:hypothetical protein